MSSDRNVPARGPSSVVVMGKQLREAVEPPRARAPRRGIPIDLEAVVMKLLAKEAGRSDRDRDGDVREALEETLRTPEKHRSRVRTMAGAVVASAMALSMGAGIVSYRAMHVTPRGPEAMTEGSRAHQGEGPLCGRDHR